MLVSFLRHAEAEDIATSDFDRALTAKGLEQADKVGKFCAVSGLIPDVILSSPLVRAEQTARCVAKRLGGAAVVVEQWIASGMGAEDFFEGIVEYAKMTSVLVVGHEPDFSETISAVLGVTNSAAIQVRKASLTMVDLRALRAGAGRLQFSIPVRLM
jgi:phosphohistidine phosphatase